MPTTSEVLEELEKAIAAGKKASAALESMQGKHVKELETIHERHAKEIHPLEIEAAGAKNAVASLMRQFQKMEEPGTSGRGRRSGSGRTYSISNASKVVATEKRAYTRAKNKGASEADAKKAGKAAAKLLSEKLGV